MDKSLIFLILFVGFGISIMFGLFFYSELRYEEESDKLHLKNCEELKAFILSEEDPSQHALNHWTVCMAGGWK